MAYEVPGFSYTLPAGADFSSANQFRFVDVNSSGQAVNPTNHGRAVGVRQNRPTSGKATTIVGGGISFVEAGGSIAAGAAVESNATGQAISAATGSVILGRALEAATGSGQQIAVLLMIQTAVA